LYIYSHEIRGVQTDNERAKYLLSWQIFLCGLPDLANELNNQFEVYLESGVREYWIIHPSEQTLFIYSLENRGFIPSRLFTSGDQVSSKVLAGFTLDLEDFFKDMD